MRISDWSSDVCSSDLYVAGDQVERYQVARYRVESNVFRHMGRRPDRRIDDDLLAVVQGETKHETRLMNCEGDKRREHRQNDQQNRDQLDAMRREIGRAHVGIPVNNENVVCRLMLEKKKP